MDSISYTVMGEKCFSQYPELFTRAQQMRRTKADGVLLIRLLEVKNIDYE